MVPLAAAIVGSVIAALIGCVLGIAAFLLTRHARSGRLRVLIAACILPFASLVWSGLAFGFQAAVNERVMHRDFGLGDAWTCPLPNGYSVLMIDSTDYGWVFNPQRQTGSAREPADAVFGVQDLQLLGPYVFRTLGQGERHQAARRFPTLFSIQPKGTTRSLPTSVISSKPPGSWA
jgi:hypothetical protein